MIYKRYDKNTDTTYTFFTEDNGGCLFLDTTGQKPGCLGTQLMKANGCAITVTPASFKTDCDSWYKKNKTHPWDRFTRAPE